MIFLLFAQNHLTGVWVPTRLCVLASLLRTQQMQITSQIHHSSSFGKWNFIRRNTLSCELQDTIDLAVWCLWKRYYFWNQRYMLGLLFTLFGMTYDQYPTFQLLPRVPAFCRAGVRSGNATLSQQWLLGAGRTSGLSFPGETQWAACSRGGGEGVAREGRRAWRPKEPLSCPATPGKKATE